MDWEHYIVHALTVGVVVFAVTMAMRSNARAAKPRTLDDIHDQIDRLHRKHELLKERGEEWPVEDQLHLEELKREFDERKFAEKHSKPPLLQMPIGGRHTNVIDKGINLAAGLGAVILAGMLLYSWLW